MQSNEAQTIGAFQPINARTAEAKTALPGDAMTVDLRTAGFKAAVIGGDGRQIAVAIALTELFPEVRIYGRPPDAVPATLKYAENLSEAIAGAKVIVLPISGMNDSGLVRGYRVDHMVDFGSCLDTLAAGTIIVAGSFSLKWLKKIDSINGFVIEYAEDDELAILNSIPTAEGAVQIAMEELPITIHGSTVLVIGFGRVGETVARTFRALGAKVGVVARRPAALAKASAAGCETLAWNSLASGAEIADIIVNTVPALVVNEAVLARVKPAVLIIDLASAPGGIDFDAAKNMNVKAKLALGLPGVVAPQTAGAILARIIPNLIRQFLTRTAAKDDKKADAPMFGGDGGVR